MFQPFLSRIAVKFQSYSITQVDKATCILIMSMHIITISAFMRNILTISGDVINSTPSLISTWWYAVWEIKTMIKWSLEMISTNFLNLGCVVITKPCLLTMAIVKGKDECQVWKKVFSMTHCNRWWHQKIVCGGHGGSKKRGGSRIFKEIRFLPFFLIANVAYYMNI